MLADAEDLGEHELFAGSGDAVQCSSVVAFRVPRRVNGGAVVQHHHHAGMAPHEVAALVGVQVTDFTIRRRSSHWRAVVLQAAMKSSWVDGRRFAMFHFHWRTGFAGLFERGPLLFHEAVVLCQRISSAVMNAAPPLNSPQRGLEQVTA